MTPCRLLLADPPWRFGDKLPGKSRGAEKNYKTLSVVEIKAFKLPQIADDALLLLWRVSAMQEEALQVVRAWGFVPKSEIVWAKTARKGEDSASALGAVVLPRLHFGMGRYVRASHETCLIAARGRAAALVSSHSIRSVFFAPTGEHSQKPDVFYEIAEQLFPGPRVELFARRRRASWIQYGDQLPNGEAHP
jgi:N6-adenosine-specific RNA methylase IME4